MGWRIGLVVLAGMAGAAQAADGPEPARIVVSGMGSVMTPPDRAAIQYEVHGEGATSDDAVRALVAKRVAIEAGLATRPGRPRPTASRITIGEVRGRECQQQYGAPRLSTGVCAIVGYVADLSLEVRMDAVKEAGTTVGLIGRLGGTNPRLAGFALADEGAAKRQATVAALVDARRQAVTIAEGTGARLGRLLSASNTGFGDRSMDQIVLSASRAPAPPPPPPPPPPPIEVDLTPQPIETQARLTVAYEVLP